MKLRTTSLLASISNLRPVLQDRARHSHQGKRQCLHTLIVLLLAAFSLEAHAVGLGAMDVHSALGEPLFLSVPIYGLQAPEQDRPCVKARISSLDGSMTAVARIQLLQEKEQRTINIQTSQAVNEPALNVSVVFGCELQQVQRDYQILLDLPVTLSQTAPKVSNSSTRLPEVDASRALSRTRTPASPAGVRVPAAHSEKPALPPPETRKSTSGNILRLSAVETPIYDQKVPARLRLSNTLTFSENQPPPAKLAELRTQQTRVAAVLSADDYFQASDARLGALESETKLLRLDALHTRQEYAAKEAFFKNSYDQLMSWAKMLGAALVACLLTLAGMGWRMVHISKSASNKSGWTEMMKQFHQPTDQQEDDNRPLLTEDSETQDDELITEDAAVEATPIVKVPGANVDKPALFEGGGRAFVTQFVKAEEISDLLELAEAWLELNRPDAVIEILEPIGKSPEPPHSPLLWLHLLRAYRLADDKHNYDELFLRIKKTFNVDIPDWSNQTHTPLATPRVLADFPHIKSRIAELWSSEEVVPYLESLLPDDRGGERLGFPIGVFQDILQLIQIAKDPAREMPVDNILPSPVAIILGRESTSRVGMLPPTGMTK